MNLEDTPTTQLPSGPGRMRAQARGAAAGAAPRPRARTHIFPDIFRPKKRSTFVFLARNGHTLLHYQIKILYNILGAGPPFELNNSPSSLPTLICNATWQRRESNGNEEDGTTVTGRTTPAAPAAARAPFRKC